MCKRILEASRNLHKRLFERKGRAILRDDVSEAVFNHICYVLPTLHDKSIFRATSFEHLGKLYFNNILASVEGATEDIIQEVIRRMSASDFTFLQLHDYWLALTKLVRMNKLPGEVYKKLKKEYDAAYLTKYQNVKQKYEIKIRSLSSEIAQLEKERREIKNRVQQNRSVTYDIALDEERYREVCSEHYRANTRKEQLTFVFDVICDKLDTFSKIDQTEEQLDTWLRKKTVEIVILDTEVKTLLLPYISFLSILESDIDNDRFILNQVKRLALVDIYREKLHKAIYVSDESTRQGIINEHVAAMASIPSAEDIFEAYKSGSNDYLEMLNRLINEFDVLGLIQEDINSSVTLRTRADLLRDVLNLYISGNYTLFNCTAPIQIEGMFADFLYAASTFNRFTDMDLFESDVLDVKLKKLVKYCDVDLEVAGYFEYYFTNLVRNRTAHGRYIKASDVQDDEILAKELLLDMKCLTHQIRRKAEIEKMLRCVKGYLDYCNILGTSSPDSIYGALYRDFIGRRIHLSYDSLDQYSSIQFLYWIINPYYERIFQTMLVGDEVRKIRGYLYSEDFWRYTYNKIQQDISWGTNFDPDVNSAVKCMFKCPLTDETKKWLGKINSVLRDGRDA